MKHDRHEQTGPLRRRAASRAGGLAAIALAGLALVLLLADRPSPDARQPSGDASSAWTAGEPAAARSARPAGAEAAPVALAASPSALAPPDEADGSGESALAAHGSERPPIPGTERAWYEGFLAAIREPGADVDALRDATLKATGPDAEKVALLRALLDSRAPDALQSLVIAAEQLEGREGQAGVSVPEYCVRTLVDRAAGDAEARAALEQLVSRRASRLEPRLRSTAAARLALTGTAPELTLLAADIRGCTDSGLLLGVAQSLEHNPEAAAVRHLFLDLPDVLAVADAQPRESD